MALSRVTTNRDGYVTYICHDMCHDILLLILLINLNIIYIYIYYESMMEPYISESRAFPRKQVESKSGPVRIAGPKAGAQIAAAWQLHRGAAAWLKGNQ